MNAVRRKRWRIPIQALLLLCEAGSLFFAVLLLAISFWAAILGFGIENAALALEGLFCLVAEVVIFAFVFRALLALHRLLRGLPVAGNSMPALEQMERIADNAALAGGVWALLITVLAICGWEGAATPDGFPRFMLPAPCLWLMALGFHVPAAFIRRTLPLTRAVLPPLPLARSLLALCAVLTAVFGCIAGPEGWLLPTCMFFTSALLLIVLWAWRGSPRLLRIAGWCLILCSAGLMLRDVGNLMADGTRLRLSLSGLMPLLPVLAMICFPAVAGMGLLLLPNLIFPVR